MSITVVVAGDLCAAGRPAVTLAGPDFGGLWSDVSPINAAADFSIVNLECPLTDRADPILKAGPHLWAPAGCIQGVQAGGFTAACLANNHILDAGSAGLLDTIEACRQVGMLHVGAAANSSEACTPLCVSLNGVRLAVLGIAENEFSTTHGSAPGACPLDVIDNGRQIAAARRTNDVVLVLFHGGVEGYPLPSPQMQKTCRHFVDMGADAVICHHTHVAGGYESYRNRPIVYGLGNLLFDCPYEPPRGWFEGSLVRMRLDRDCVPELELIPYQQRPEIPSIRLLGGSEKEAFLSRLADLNGLINDPPSLDRRWSLFCEERREDLLSAMLCLTRFESWLLDHHLLPTTRLRLTQRRLAALSNLFSCESHAESCRRLLRDLLDQR